WEGWAILLRQKQKKLIMLPSETMIWQPEFTDKTLSRKPGAVQSFHQSATTKNLFCHKAGGSSFSGCRCYFPTYWLGLFRGTAVNWWRTDLVKSVLA
ncbi:hypothetical protein, partial [Escherichia coli]|uniref:hypothetical protein n=1 Tax=Escherichia coli TaxID=562 RepID=UPI00374DEA34